MMAQRPEDRLKTTVERFRAVREARARAAEAAAAERERRAREETESKGASSGRP